MEGYREEERHRKLQEEQELLDALADTERDTEKTGECSTWTARDSQEDGTPPVSATVLPPQASDSGQQLGPSDGNLTELEITLANPNLGPEHRKFAESARFKNLKKMVPGNVMTTR